MNTPSLTATTETTTERFENFVEVHVGEWYWYQGTKKDFGSNPGDDVGPDLRVLVCVIEVGSNYFKVKNGCRGWRIHANEFAQVCRRELRYQEEIQAKVQQATQHVETLLNQVAKLTHDLGVQPTQVIESNNARALSTLNAADNVSDYKKSLIEAQASLPKLFEEIREANKKVAYWMETNLVPLEAKLSQYQGVVDIIKDRVFHVELYAGLTEEVSHFAKGAPAPATEKLHLMQMTRYMDEECLADYAAGGMEFADLAAFNQWLAQPEHRDSVFLHPRCIVAFQVRRHEKRRLHYGQIELMIDNHRKADADKWTYLYIRNGENLYCLCCELDFDDKIFPDGNEFDFTVPMVAKSGRFSGDAHWTVITAADLEQRKIEHARRVAADAAWMEMRHAEEKAKPKKERKDEFWWNHNAPYYHSKPDIEGFEPFNQDSVYYDDIKASVGKQIQQYNRIALIVQGLFDRSEILHPHARTALWTQEGFESAVTLVKENNCRLHYGEPPGIFEYQARCNASLKVGSVCVGQELIWRRREAQKENQRTRYQNNHRDRDEFSPPGNDGPGYLARVASMTKTKVTFVWYRERQTGPRYDRYWERRRNDGPIKCTLTVNKSEILCVDGYKRGDFKPFFQDPRSQEKYLEWAPLLCAAEDYHAGKLSVGYEGWRKSREAHFDKTPGEVVS